MMSSSKPLRKRSFRRVDLNSGAKILAVFWLLFGCEQTNGQGLLDEAGALKGLGGVYIMGGDVEGELIHRGLEKEQVLARVTSRINTEGIRVLDEMDWLLLESAPVLFVDIKAENGVYVVRLEILHLVHPVSDPSSTSYAVIWGDGRAGPIDDDSVEAVLRDLDLLATLLADDFNANQ